MPNQSQVSIIKPNQPQATNLCGIILPLHLNNALPSTMADKVIVCKFWNENYLMKLNLAKRIKCPTPEVVYFHSIQKTGLTHIDLVCSR